MTGVTHLYDKLPVFFNVFVCLLLLTFCLRLEGDIDIHPQLLTTQSHHTNTHVRHKHEGLLFKTSDTHFLYPSYSLTTEEGWRASSSQIWHDRKRCTTQGGEGGGGRQYYHSDP